MQQMHREAICLSGLLSILALANAPLYATVSIVSITPSPASPQYLGTPITWTVTATDTNPGPLTFQFNTAYGRQAFSLARDFNMGTLASGTWTAPSFVWTTIGGEGTYQIQVIAKDFTSGETATQTATFQLKPLVSTQAAIHRTANPLVALFSAPSCATGSSLRVSFAASGATPSYTNWAACRPPLSMNFYVAGMLPSTTYAMNYQIDTGGTVTGGPTPLNFTTGALPTQIVFPSYSVVTPPGPTADTRDTTLLHAVLADAETGYLPMATDLNGNVTWYYASTGSPVLTRPLSGGYMLTLQNGVAWNPALTFSQYFRETDLAGNIVKETNTGVISQELLALGATDATPCNAVPMPPPVGTACLNHFHHDAVQLPDGDYVVLGRLEKLYPPGTQGSTTGQPVDILGDMAIVLNSNMQVIWYFDEFQGLNINRAAPLGETCANAQNGNPPTCPLVELVLSNIANDWTHTNSIYYISSSGDIILSLRNQDWVIKIDYDNGSGAGDVLWTMGVDGSFTFNNIANDPYPWFSHQHDAEYQTNGALTVFDNGNTRTSPPPIGIGPGYSRGMAFTVDETTMEVTPIISEPLGVFCYVMGSASLLYNGNYFFQPALPTSYDIQITPEPPAVTGTQAYSLSGPPYIYRAWQLQSLYIAPVN